MMQFNAFLNMLTSQLWTQVIKSVFSLHSHYLSALKSLKQAHVSPRANPNQLKINTGTQLLPAVSWHQPQKPWALAAFTSRPTWALGHLVSHSGSSPTHQHAEKQLQDTQNSVATHVRNWLPLPVYRRLHTRQGLATRASHMDTSSQTHGYIH